jgi:hypothetical protein
MGDWLSRHNFEGAIFGSCQKVMLLIQFFAPFKVPKARYGLESRLIKWWFGSLLEKARFGFLEPR